METRDIGADSAPPSALPRAVVRLGWVSFLTDVSSEMIVPLLPAFLVTVLGAPALALGWIEGVAETTASVVKVISGRMADRARSKKPLVILGYGISSLARPLISLAGSWPVVLGIRFVDRIGKGIRSAPRDALIASVAPAGRRGEAFGLHRGFDNAGAVLGPLVAASLVGLLGLPLRWVFALAAVPALLSVVVLVAGVRETRLPSPGATALPVGAAPLPASFKRAVGVICLFTLAASSDTFILLRARELGAAAATLPLLWSLSNAVRASLSRWGGRLSDRWGRQRSLAAAWLIYAAGYGAFGLAPSVALLTVVLVVYSLHAALAEGAERALVADLVPEEARGRAFGWLHGLMGFAALPASVLFGFVWERFGSKAAFLAGAGVAALAVLALVVLVPRARPEPRR